MEINEFIKELNDINVKITQTQLDQLNQYYHLLIEYNKVMNLTGITEKEQVYLKHFYDSLTLAKIIDLYQETSLCDIGTGAGFPGLVIKILFPHLKITLLDALHKRVKFLQTVIDQLQLTDIEVIHTRVEEFALKNRNRFDITTARAVAHTSILLEYAIPLTKEHKYFITLKGNMEEELTEIDHALKQLKCTLKSIQRFQLPIEESNRTIAMFQKNQDVKKYPRKMSEIKKQRL